MTHTESRHNERGRPHKSTNGYDIVTKDIKEGDVSEKRSFWRLLKKETLKNWEKIEVVLKPYGIEKMNNFHKVIKESKTLSNSNYSEAERI